MNLHRAVKLSSIDDVKALLVAGALVNEKEANGNSPLHLACRHAPEMIKKREQR